MLDVKSKEKEKKNSKKVEKVKMEVIKCKGKKYLAQSKWKVHKGKQCLQVVINSFRQSGTHMRICAHVEGYTHRETSSA